MELRASLPEPRRCSPGKARERRPGPRGGAAGGGHERRGGSARALGACGTGAGARAAFGGVGAGEPRSLAGLSGDLRGASD